MCGWCYVNFWKFLIFWLVNGWIGERFGGCKVVGEYGGCCLYGGFWFCVVDVDMEEVI